MICMKEDIKRLGENKTIFERQKLTSTSEMVFGIKLGSPAISWGLTGSVGVLGANSREI